MTRSQFDQSELVQLTRIEQSNNNEPILLVNEEAVESVWGNPKYEDCYPVIYTIAGPARSGKSFLFSLLWSFLKQKNQNTSYNVWSKNVERLRKVFKWRRGAKSCTEGIYVLKEPITFFFKEKRIALFLADTQGMFELKSSQRNQTFLGTLSFLISSFVVFNVDKNINTKHLEIITKFLTNLRSSDGSFAMQKESLMFVVRDWDYTDGDEDRDSNDDDDDKNQEYEYGMEGGKTYFDALIRNDSQSKAKEHQMTLEYLDCVFGDNIPCCLLPHPGEAVKRSICSINKLDENFRQAIFELFEKIKHESKFKIKEIRKQSEGNASTMIKCGDLCKAIKKYVSQFGTHLGITDSSLFIGKNFKVSIQKLMEERVHEFLKLSKVREAWGGNKVNSLRNLKETKARMIKKFRQEDCSSYPQIVLGEWEKKLDSVLSQMIKNFKICFELETEYIKAMQNYKQWQKKKARNHLKEDPEDFADWAHEKCESVLQELQNNIRQKSDSSELLEDIFVQSKKNFENSSKVLTKAIQVYIKNYSKLKKLKPLMLLILSGMIIGFEKMIVSTTVIGSAIVSTNADNVKINKSEAKTTESKVKSAKTDGVASERSSIGSDVAKALLVAAATEAKNVEAAKAKVSTATVYDILILHLIPYVVNICDGFVKDHFLKKIEKTADGDEKSETSLKLQQYEEGQMKMELSLGTLTFELKA